MEQPQIADIYRQLALLLASDLPLPESLSRLAAGFRRGNFRSALFRVAQTTESGSTLSQAMRRFPQYFNPFHVRMVEHGERGGTLPETLSEVAHLAHLESQMISTLRTVAAYPVFVMLFAASVTFLLFSLVVPDFDLMFGELNPRGKPSLSTSVTLALSDVMVAYFWPVAVMLGISVCFCIWLFTSKSRRAIRVLLRIVKRIPLSFSIFHNLSMARISALWAVLASHHTPAHEAFELIAGLTDDRKLERALRDVAVRAARGDSIVDGLQSQDAVSPLLALTFKHTPETELPRELHALADLYRDRMGVAIQKTVQTWEVVLVAGMSIIVGFVVLSLFSPLIDIIRYMA